jgi:TusA-related sulfurtransferase
MRTLLDEKNIKNIISSLLLSTLNELRQVNPNKQIEQIIESKDFIDTVTNIIYEEFRIRELVENFDKILEQHKYDDLEKQIELEKFFFHYDLLPTIIEGVYSTVLDKEFKRRLEERIDSVIEETIQKLHNSNERPVFIAEDFSFDFWGFLFKASMTLGAIIVITVIALLFRIPQRLILSVSSVLKKIGEYLKDIQKDNLTITEFFQNIPPECLKEFSDLWPDLKVPTLDPYKFKSETELQLYKQEILDKLRKKLMHVDIFRGVYDKVKIAKSKGTICTIKYFISMTGVLLYTYYHCLAKNGNLKLLNEVLKIKADDIVTTDSDILDALADSVPNVCLAKYKDFKKVLKFTTEVIKTIYKDLDPELYSQLLNELIQTIDKAHREGQRILKKVQPRDRSDNNNRNRNDRDNKRRDDNRRLPDRRENNMRGERR